MKWVRLICAACAALIAWSGKTEANDSSANQTTGGLVLTKTDAIAMRSEELRISMKKIEVRYEFQNVTDRDVTLTVAFPLPDLEPDYVNAEAEGDVVGEDFTTTVEGIPVVMQVERRALLGGKDVTAKLIAFGLSLDPRLVAEKLEALSDVDAEKLEMSLMEAGLLSTPERRTQWTYQRRFYREQVFPAGKTLFVAHRYTPSVGTSLALPEVFAGREEMATDAMAQLYCIESDVVRTLRSRELGRYGSRYINYILSSGANWAGGKIDDFRLVVDKGDPENLISFCGTGIRKISATEFEMRKRNFHPQGDLNIAIFGRHSKLPSPPGP